VLIELFDREFVETQEDVGMRVMGQFRDLGDPDRFVWLRGFADMSSRPEGLQAFYGGPIWAAHRNVANATMIDSDNVLLLRPAWDGAELPFNQDARAARDAIALPPGMLDATVFHLKEPADSGLIQFCRSSMSEVLRRGGAKALGWYVTESAPNNFPRLPVREGESVLVGLALFEDVAAFEEFAQSGVWQRDFAPVLEPWLKTPAQSMRLTPTARSVIHA
jgi:hypothetical protein